ncbi:hypothetical protein J6590_077646 [Homalodisca vitripennis]|nr:hypothetical protein J6590_077646 [Homalodisca vitripennis]
MKLRFWTRIGHCKYWISTVKAPCKGMTETSQRLAQTDFRGNLQDGVPGTTTTGPKKGVLDRSIPSGRGCVTTGPISRRLE